MGHCDTRRGYNWGTGPGKSLSRVPRADWKAIAYQRRKTRKALAALEREGISRDEVKASYVEPDGTVHLMMGVKHEVEKRRPGRWLIYLPIAVVWAVALYFIILFLVKGNVFK